jgi:hypothetical protein
VPSPGRAERDHQVDAGDDGEVPSLLGAKAHAAASVPVTPARIEGLRTSSPALGGPEVIAAGMEEVVDLTAERRRDKRQAVETMLLGADDPTSASEAGSANQARCVLIYL